MPSPFPGMNPYLERAEVWKSFHHRFITAAAEALGGQLGPGYYVKIEEQVYIHERSADERRPLGHPDLSVHTRGPSPTARGGAVAAPAVAFVPAAVDEVRIPFLEVRDRRNRQVVTVVELLSPSNKYAGADRDQYWSKVRQVMATMTEFVEIDLLRGGPRMPWEGLPACDYYALVSRYVRRPQVDVWPVRVRDRLPGIPIPLRPGEPEPTLDLQAVLHRVYDAARYDLHIYDGDPEPPLAPDDAAWARGLVTPTGP
jgi:hypothetical protein